MTVESQISKYIDEGIQICNRAGLKVHRDQISFVLDKTYTRSLGLITIVSMNHFRIKISGYTFQHDSPALRDTCLHEVAHAVDKINFDGWGHGKTWKSIMRLMGLSTKAKVSESETTKYGHELRKRKTHPRYSVHCLGCGKDYMVTKRTLNTLSDRRCSCGSKKLQIM